MAYLPHHDQYTYRIHGATLVGMEQPLDGPPQDRPVFSPDHPPRADDAFLLTQTGAMLRLLVGASHTLPGEPMCPLLLAEIRAFLDNAIVAGIDVIAVSESDGPA